MNSHKQQGAALITVMIMVTVVIAVLASMFHQHGIDVAKSTKILHSERAALLALSGESWAISILKQDERESQGTDTLQDIWAFGLPPLPVEGGLLTGTMTDLQSLWNVNNLQPYTSAILNTINTSSNGNSDPAILARLGTSLEVLIEPRHTASIIDWLDSDNTPLPSGGEENEYLLENPAYRPGNTLFSSIDELSLVLGLPPEILAVIGPHITALPATTPINVNTASKEVLQSLHEDISDFVADNLLEAREIQPWNSLEEFSDALDLELRPITAGDIKRQIEIPPAGASIPNFEPISINSNYFLLSIAVELGSNIVELDSLIRRNSATDVVVLARTLRYVANTIPIIETDE